MDADEYVQIFHLFPRRFRRSLKTLEIRVNPDSLESLEDLDCFDQSKYFVMLNNFSRIFYDRRILRKSENVEQFVKLLTEFAIREKI